jgi:hypothetical protein
LSWAWSTDRILSASRTGLKESDLRSWAIKQAGSWAVFQRSRL